MPAAGHQGDLDRFRRAPRVLRLPDRPRGPAGLALAARGRVRASRSCCRRSCSNSAWWAQCDSIYASLCLGSLYFLLRRQTALACRGVRAGVRLQAAGGVPAAGPAGAGRRQPAPAARPAARPGDLPGRPGAGVAGRPEPREPAGGLPGPGDRQRPEAGRWRAVPAPGFGGGPGGGSPGPAAPEAAASGAAATASAAGQRPRTASPTTPRPGTRGCRPARRLDLDVGRARPGRGGRAGVRGLAGGPAPPARAAGDAAGGRDPVAGDPAAAAADARALLLPRRGARRAGDARGPTVPRWWPP